MSTYIIADLHLAPNKPILTNALSNFYEKNLIINDTLIIAGDMFDFFIGIDRNSRFHQKIRSIILKARKNGIKTYFQTGNRDFLMDKESAAFFGMKLIEEQYTINTHEGQALLIHGDQLCKNDRSLQNFRRFSNNKFIRKIFMSLPYSWRYKIALRIRNKSKGVDPDLSKNNPLESPEIKEVAKQMLLSSGSRILIHGHFHIFGGEDDAFGKGSYRFGLGAWDSNYSYVKIDRRKLELIQRSMKKNF